MQTVPTSKTGRTMLSKTEAKKAKVSLGIQTSKPVEQINAGKQNAEVLHKHIITDEFLSQNDMDYNIH